MSFASAFERSFAQGTDAYNRRVESDRQYDLQKERHDADMKETGLRLGAMQRVNDATARLDTIQNVGMPMQANIQAKDDDFETANAAALAGKDMPAYNASTYAAPDFRRATPQELARGVMGLAAAKGDSAGLLAGQNQMREFDINDTAKANIERAAKDPEYRAQLLKNVNTQSKSLTIDDGIDKKTGKKVRAERITWVDNNGDTHAFEPNENQLNAIVYGAARMEHGDVAGGLSQIASVNKDLAALAHQHHQETLGAFDSNVKSAGEWDAHQDRLHAQSIREKTLGLQRSMAPQPLSAAAQSELSKLQAGMEAAKSPYEMESLRMRFNARLAMEQQLGRGTHISMLPGMSGQGRSGGGIAEQAKFRDMFSDQDAGPGYTAPNGTPLKIGQLSPEQFRAVYAGYNGGGGDAGPGGPGLPSITTLKPKAGAPGPRATATAPQESKPTYGLLSAPRMSYLQTQAQRGTASPQELQELQALQGTRDNAWFRGRASESDYGQ